MSRATRYYRKHLRISIMPVKGRSPRRSVVEGGAPKGVYHYYVHEPYGK